MAANTTGKLALDLKHSLRALSRHPGTAVGIAAVVAVGVGLVTAMFALVDPYLLKPLPYLRAQQIVVIGVSRTDDSPRTRQALPTVRDLQSRRDLFSAVGAYRFGAPIRFYLPAGAAVANSLEVTDGFFDVFGLPRLLNSPGIQEAGHITTGSFTAKAFRRFASLVPELRGKVLQRQDGGSVEILAPLPEAFVLPSRRVFFPTELLLPAADTNMRLDVHGVVFGRVREGATIPEVKAALSNVPLPGGTRLEVESLSDYLRRDTRTVAAGALASAVLILLVCIGNVSNLIIGRSLFREHEFAIRRSIGATRMDVVRLVCLELTLTTAVAVAVAVLLAHLALMTAASVMPAEYVWLGEPGVSTRSIIFATFCGAAVVSAGSLGALLVWNMSSSLADTRLTVRSRSTRAIRFLLTASQSALTMLLLAGAALLGRSHYNLFTQETGFSGNVAIASVSYPPTQVGTLLQHDIDSTLATLRSLKGVERTAATVGTMLDRRVTATGLLLPDGRYLGVTVKEVTPEYFATVGASVLKGRTLETSDRSGRAFVITKNLADQGWPTGSAIGARVGAEHASEIVGVTGDEFSLMLDRKPEPTVFRLLENPGQACTGSGCDNRVHYLVRLTEASDTPTALIQRAITSANPDAVIYDVSLVNDRLGATVKDRSFATLIFGLFAMAASGVCAAGLVSVVAFGVTRRTREIAIRIAIGASRPHVLGLVTREVILAVSMGVLVGAWCSRLTARVLEHLLYEVRPGDLATICMAAVALSILSALAVYVPARRALTLPPTIALRAE